MASLTMTLTTCNALGLLALWVLYRGALALYNVSPLHPLSRFPGPKLAAMSFLYEFWYDVIHQGTYSMRIKDMHEKYGPIVRINPEELHCNDANFIDEIYAGGNRKRDKQAHNMNIIAGPLALSMFGTLDHETHRIRRAAMNKYFSRGQMLNMEPEIHALVQQLCDKMLRSTEPINLPIAFSCFTSDTISQYSYGEPMGLLSQNGWEPNFKKAVSAYMNTAMLFRFFPLARSFTNLMPCLARYTSGEIRLLMKEMYETLPARIRAAIADHDSGKAHKRFTIFSDLLNSSLPDSDKTVYRMAGEGFSLMTAGTETTAATLTVITYYLLEQPVTRTQLESELQNFDPKDLSWTVLEKLPLLSAVILEGLRLSYGVTVRLPRIARDEELIYRSADDAHQYVIPKGTPIGMSAVIMHHNEDPFPNSFEFNANRWLHENGQRRRDLERYIIPFSRGSRQCLGMNLAYCELYLVTAAMVLRVLPRMKIHETTIDDVKYDHDLLSSQPKKGSKGIRAIIVSP